MKYLILFLALALTGPIVIATPTKAESPNPSTNNAQARSQTSLTRVTPNANVSINNRVEDGAPVPGQVPKTPVLASKAWPGPSDPQKITDPAMKRQNHVPPLPPMTTRVKQGPAPY